MQTYWHKQTSDRPLFPDLLWSRPENRQHAGKLLIVGGNRYGFVEPAEAFRTAETTGIGTTRMLLPNSLKPYVGKVFTAGVLAPSTPSGSLSRQALEPLLHEAVWADGVLLAGGLGRNSETAILLEKFASKFSGQLTITKDAVDYFASTPLTILTRSETTLVISLAQLQKFASNAKFPKAFTFDTSLMNLVEALYSFSRQYPANIVVKHLEHIFVASRGQVSTTKLIEDKPVWRVTTAAVAAVWWIQNPRRPFEALTAALYSIIS